MMYDPNDLLGAFVAPLVVILGLLLRAVILPLANALLLAAACFIVGGNYVVVRPSYSMFAGDGICLLTSSLVSKVDRAGPSGFVIGVESAPFEAGSSPALVTFISDKSPDPVDLFRSKNILNRLWFRRSRDGDGFFFLTSGVDSASGLTTILMFQNLTSLLTEKVANGGKSAIICPIACCALFIASSIFRKRKISTRLPF